MGVFALILGMLATVCTILGVVTVAEVLPPLGDAYTWEFWFWLSAILFLATIAVSVGRSGEYE